MSEYFPEWVAVELDLSNYATNADFKNEIRVDYMLLSCHVRVSE